MGHVSTEVAAHGDGHAHPGPRTYVLVGAILAIITLLEIYVYSRADIHPIVVPILLVLSAVKFVLVVGFFMHLKFDSAIFTAMFGFGLAVAGSVITALLFLFGQYPRPPYGG